MNVSDILSDIADKAVDTASMDRILFSDITNGIIEFTEIILGMAIIIIFILVPIVISLELIYINAPVTRDLFDSIKGSNRKVSKIAEFCLRDAVESVERAAMGEYCGNANNAYVVIKVKSVTVIGFVVALTLQGVSVLSGISYGLVGKAIETILNLLQ